MRPVTHLRFADGYRPSARPRTPETRLGQLSIEGDWLNSLDNWLWGSGSPTTPTQTFTPSGGTDVSTLDALTCSDFGACGSEIAAINSGPQSVVDNCNAMYGAGSPACLAAQGLATSYAGQTPGLVSNLTTLQNATSTFPTWAWFLLGVGALILVEKL
jgi:hypothetical protein